MLVNPPLFAHQEDVASRIASGRPLAVYCEQGTGKTRAVLEGLVRLKDPWPALVICPKTVMGVWEDEARRWIDVEAILVRGDAQKRGRLLARDGKLWVINYESLRAASKSGWGVNAWGKRFKTLSNWVRACKPWRTAIGDESSRIKHADSQQSKAMHLFCDVPQRAIMTGTPITHSPLDLWSQFRFLVPDLFPRNFRVFRDPYVVVVRRPIPGGATAKGYTHFDEVVAYRNLGDLYARVAPHVIRYRKEDCLDLPPKLYQTIKVELSEEQRKTYDGLVRDMLAEVGAGVIVAQSALAKLTRLQQVCQGFAVTEDGAVHEFAENPKLEALKDQLEQALAAGEDRKVAVWCRFLRDMDAVVKLLSEDLKVGTVRIQGETSGSDRDEAVRRFQRDPSVRAFVGQEQAAGFGVTLTAASFVGYYSQDWNYDDRVQSEDRSHRIGTRLPVQYTDFVCVQTVDETLVRNLRGKRRLAGAFDGAALRRIVDGGGEEAVGPEPEGAVARRPIP